MTTTADTLTDLVYAALTTSLPGTTTPPTAAGSNVFKPRDWPYDATELPAIRLDLASEDKESWDSPGDAAFTVTATLPIIATVQAAAGSADSGAADSGAAAVRAALMALRRQIEIAVINYPPLRTAVEKIPFVRSSFKIKADEALHEGEVEIRLGLQFVQTAEDFYPAAVEPFELVALTGTATPDATAAAPYELTIPQT
jgi:hypothetical protein